MYTNDYMYAVERDANYLAHYGILGMKWGVRRAIAGGNMAKLGRQYAKAQKKLAKLQNRANNTKKYAKRAALMGTGAAVAGGLAAAGTHGIGTLMNKAGAVTGKAMRGAGRGMQIAGTGIHKGLALVGQGSLGNRIHKRLDIVGGGLQKNSGATGVKVSLAGDAVRRWGNSTSISRGVGQGIANRGSRVAVNGLLTGDNARRIAGAKAASSGARLSKSGITNNTIARVGAGIVAGGLAAGAARNAYKAATAKRKVEKFRKAMNESFKGTKYATGSSVSTPRQGGKKRRRK